MSCLAIVHFTFIHLHRFLERNGCVSVVGQQTDPRTVDRTQSELSPLTQWSLSE